MCPCQCVNVIVVLNANVLRLDEDRRVSVEVGFQSGLESITADRCRAELCWQ